MAHLTQYFPYTARQGLILPASASRIRVVSRNVNSLGDDRKTNAIYNYMYKNSADVFILLDTRTGPEDTTRLKKNGKVLVSSIALNPMPEALLSSLKTALLLKMFKLSMLSLEIYLMCPLQPSTKDIWQSLSMDLIGMTQIFIENMCSTSTISQHTTMHCGLGIGTLCWTKLRILRITKGNITKKQRVV